VSAPGKKDGLITSKRIEGVRVKELKRISDERGWLMEMLRSDDEMFSKFGQAYLTCAYPGVVKAWHFHRIQTDYFVCVQGMAKVVLYDPREDSPTRGHINEFFLGDLNPQLVQIPPLVYHGFKGISPAPAVMLNMPTEVYNYAEPDENRVPPHGGPVPYDWTRKDG
jgi:dTDP-4-dehydrorhamnose 3,5-epimerase